ncbi:MAG: helix-turn-helix domain-containing protein [Candidatus Peribacteria bacterium]|jgi:sugar-specific transcriptional regulator TrmB|nr:helix-turn-helix domain-containing protein [Candidatus Peribacteria bacterium]
MLTDLLQHYDFTEREAKVYLAGLSLGSAPGSTIARHAGEKRVTVYAILKELIKRGIFTSVIRDEITYFSPISPEQLAYIYEEKYKTLKEKLPELTAIMETVGNKPKMRYFEGVEGIKHLYNNSLETPEPVFAFLSDGNINPKLQHYLNKEFAQKRIKKQIFASVIVSKEKSGNYLQTLKISKMMQKYTSIKTVKKDIFTFEGEIILYGGNSILCALYSDEEMIGYSLQSKQLYKMLKGIFDFIWKKV